MLRLSVLFAMTIPGLTVGLVAFAVGERVVARVRARGGVRPQRRPVSVAGLDALSALVEPGRAHELERRRTEALWREDEEEGAPPRSRVDLDAGIAYLRLPGRSAEKEG
jgi:hypothetical protein